MVCVCNGLTSGLTVVPLVVSRTAALVRISLVVALSSVSARAAVTRLGCKGGEMKSEYGTHATGFQ